MFSLEFPAAAVPDDEHIIKKAGKPSLFSPDLQGVIKCMRQRIRGAPPGRSDAAEKNK